MDMGEPTDKILALLEVINYIPPKVGIDKMTRKSLHISARINSVRDQITRLRSKCMYSNSLTFGELLGLVSKVKFLALREANLRTDLRDLNRIDKVRTLRDLIRDYLEEEVRKFKSGNRKINFQCCQKKDLPLRKLYAQVRALSESRRDQAQKFFNEINTRSSKCTLISCTGAEHDAVEVTIPDEVVIGEVLHNLAHDHDFMPDGATLVKPNGKTEMTKYSLKVNMKLGNQPFEFVIRFLPPKIGKCSSTLPKEIDNAACHSYDAIAEQLDSGDPAHNAETILKVVDARGDEVINWGAMTVTATRMRRRS